MSRFGALGALAVSALLGAFAFAAVPACAQGLAPWWHITSITQPSYVQPGSAKQQVWKLTLSATTGHVILEVGPYGFVEIQAGEPRSEVQASIEGVLREEESFPGSGRLVEVTAQAGTYNKFETYEIKLTGEIEYTHYFEFYMAEEALQGGPAKMSLEDVSRGRSDGVIVVTATNLGDAPTATECEKVAPKTGKFADARCTEPVGEAQGFGEFEAKATGPITISDALPQGLEAVQIEGAADENLLESGSARHELSCSLEKLSCTFLGGEVINRLATPDVSVAPYEQIKVEIAVNVTGAQTSAINKASVEGGGAPPASVEQPFTISDAPVPSGAAALEMRPEQEGGALDTQAGSHPFQLTTTFVTNSADVEGTPAAGPVKDLHFSLPTGLIGNPSPFTQCTLAQFLTNPGRGGETTLCPPQSIVGVARSVVKIKTGFSAYPQETTLIAPIYNLEPAVGEPARFGFIVQGEPVELDAGVQSGGDYGVTITVKNITQAVTFLSSEATFWGVPGDSAHNASRGDACLDTAAARRAPERIEALCPGFAQITPPPLLSLGTYCSRSDVGSPLPMQASVEGDSWEDPGNVYPPQLNTAPMPALDGCNRLPFEPSIEVTPDGTAASTPMGVNVDVHVDQESALSAQGLAESAVRTITVALPEGVAINPAGGDGLEACSEPLAGFQVDEGTGGFVESPLERGVSNPSFTPYLPGSVDALAAGQDAPFQPGIDFCADASKIGEVTIKTPLLPKGQFVKGFVYLATQNANPFGSLIAMYLIAEDPISGTVVKLPGAVHLTATGQIVTTFENEPELPFEDAELHFFGGERAPLSSPAHCGAYTTEATFTPWSGDEPVKSSATFDITSGPHGAPCPGTSLPFQPSLTAGTTNINAGAFTPLTTTIGREDGNQDLQSVQLHMPEGLEGLLTGVKLCPEAQANDGTCGPESLIGETTVSAGIGSDPVSVVGGEVYLTEKYAGAPFGLSIVNPVKAGPFDLEHDTSKPETQDPPCDCLVVRAKIEVNPRTAELTVTTDPSGPHAIPHLIDGIPVQIKKVNVLINRPGFTFNPTSCNPTSLTASIASDEGASAPVSVPFQIANCANLKFTPSITATTAGHASKAEGASLFVKISYPKGALGSQAWVNEAKLQFPKQLPAELRTIQKACLAATFEGNRAACPPQSIIGHAVVHTPVVPVPLEGPVYFVSNGGKEFPEAVLVLDGYGIHVELHGETFIEGKTGVTTATFRDTPDVPFETLEVSVPSGPFSEFGANLPGERYDFCGQKLVMPTFFKASNGAEIHQNTTVGVTGCPTKLSITSHTIKGRAVSLTVYAPAAGKLKLSGATLGTVTKTVHGTETVTLTLHARRAGHARRKITVTFAPSSGRKQSASISLRT
jgi:hypothetical protein